MDRQGSNRKERSFARFRGPIRISLTAYRTILARIGYFSGKFSRCELVLLFGNIHFLYCDAASSVVCFCFIYCHIKYVETGVQKCWIYLAIIRKWANQNSSWLTLSKCWHFAMLFHIGEPTYSEIVTYSLILP